MKEYISFMKAVCWTLLVILVIFGLCSWRAYNKMIAKRFVWECYWEEVKEDNYLHMVIKNEAKEAAEAEKREAMYSARSKCNHK